MRNNASLLLWFLVCWGIFQGAFTLGQYYQNRLNQERFLASIEIRVALDLPKLKIANDKFKTAADPLSIQAYIQHFNTYLNKFKSPVLLFAIQGIEIEGYGDINSDKVIHRSLQTADQLIDIKIQSVKANEIQRFSLFSLICALFMVLVRIFSRSAKSHLVVSKQLDLTQHAPPKLIINLKNKTLYYGNNSEPVLLSNKPFCFYAALIDYCLHTDFPNLKNNNDIPDDLLQIANKYFYRLIELGHTKRKRPDFGANLDKTLSEIRSALDEVFKNNTDIKELFYPPKAQGEGSRSKMHNYAISNKSTELVEFIGK